MPENKKTLSKDEITARFKKETKEIFVEGWGTNVTIRKLGTGEKNKIDAIIVEDMELTPGNEDRYMTMKTGLIGDQTVSLVSTILVSPKMKVEELNNLSADAMEGITEIKRAYDEWDKPKKSSKAQKGTSKEE